MNVTAKQLRGEVFYDVGCGLCSRGAARWSGLFERRGFHWLPLQTPTAAARLKTSEPELRAEMKLMLADGRVVGGASAWAVLFRTVWWLWPLGVVMELPGVKNLCGLLYRATARNRRWISAAYRLSKRSSAPHRHAAFLELP